MMLTRVAPSALRTPISRVRSVTDTSMMFMIPMPPTSEAHRRDAGQQRGEDLGGLLLGGQDVLLVADLEVVVAAGPDLVLAAHHPLDVHHALLERDAVPHLDRDRPEPVGAHHPVPGGLQRDQDLLVGVLERPCRSLLGCSTPMISKGMPRIRMVWPIIAAGLASSISGTSYPSTA